MDHDPRFDKAITIEDNGLEERVITVNLSRLLGNALKGAAIGYLSLNLFIAGRVYEMRNAGLTKLCVEYLVYNSTKDAGSLATYPGRMLGHSVFETRNHEKSLMQEDFDLMLERYFKRFAAPSQDPRKMPLRV